MIICPSCGHPNPDGATHCEACFSDLQVPSKIKCPNCGAEVQADALFCGNCGFNLKAAKTTTVRPMTMTPDPQPEVQPLPISEAPEPEPVVKAGPAPTQVQLLKAALLHVQTNTIIELPTHLSVIHVGKPNNVIPPDVDVSGFPNSDIVSRVHADIRIEGNSFYLEDTGSSNGTYVNNLPLPVGNKHKLRHGDRLALGKGDKVSFIFQVLA